jgi:hypothetical protein
MRHGSGTASFDLSDTDPPLDTVDSILSVATSVLVDYASESGHSRIERMARWIVLNLGDVDTYSIITRVGSITHHELERSSVWRVGEQVGATTNVATREGRRDPQALRHEDARAMAVALFRAVEEAED